MLNLLNMMPAFEYEREAHALAYIYEPEFDSCLSITVSYEVSSPFACEWSEERGLGVWGRDSSIPRITLIVHPNSYIEKSLFIHLMKEHKCISCGVPLASLPSGEVLTSLKCSNCQGDMCLGCMVVVRSKPLCKKCYQLISCDEPDQTTPPEYDY